MSAGQTRGEPELHEKVALGLLVALGLIWVGAKAHFFARFGSDTIEDYLWEHSPFWGGMAFVGALLLIVGALGSARRISRRS